jgi:hypothetical protein
LSDKVRVRVIVVAVGHELHKSPPLNAAPANSRSPEVQLLGSIVGNDCPNAIVIFNKVNITMAIIFFELVIFDFIKYRFNLL